MLVEDDEVERQPLEAQVLVRLQELDDQRRGRLAADPDQQDRKIPGNAVFPELALTAAGSPRPRPAWRSRVSPDEQAAAETLERDRVFDGQIEVPQLDLAMRAGQCQRARDGAAIVVLLDQAAARASSLSA